MRMPASLPPSLPPSHAATRPLPIRQTAAVTELERLQAACAQPPKSLIDLAASCGRCKAETAVAGRVCRHCRLEELFLAWEVRRRRWRCRCEEDGCCCCWLHCTRGKHARVSLSPHTH